MLIPRAIITLTNLQRRVSARYGVSCQFLMVGFAKAQEQGMRVGGAFCSKILIYFNFLSFLVFSTIIICLSAVMVFQNEIIKYILGAAALH